MARAAPGAAVALTVFLDKVFTGLGQTQDVLYFTTWTGNGENLMPHMNAIKEQANFFPKNRLVVDAGTMEHVKNTGSLENTKVVMDLDADVFAKAKARDHTADLTSGAAVKIAMITSTKRTDRSLEKQLSFVEPSYFYERRPEEYPDYTQFNSDLILMRKAAATKTALVIGLEQLRTIVTSRVAMVERIVGNEKNKMTLHEAVRATHPGGARFIVPSQTSVLLHRRRAPLWPEYTPTRLKTAYVGAIGLNPLDVVLTKRWKLHGQLLVRIRPREINGEKFIRRDTCAVLRTLVLKGDMNTRKLFLSNCALNPADVGAVSRQDAQNWFGDSKSDHLDVPVYTLEEEGAIGLPDGSPLSSPEHSGPSRPELTEVETPVKANPPVETGLSLTSPLRKCTRLLYPRTSATRCEGHHSPADYYWLTRSSMQMLSLVSVDILVSFTQPSIKMDLVVDRDANHCDLSLYRSGATTTYCCTGSDCFPAGLQDVSRCELLMPVVSPQTTTSNYTTTRVTVTAKGFGIAALKDRESGRYETPEGLDLHSRLDNVNTVRMVLSKEVTVVFNDQFSGIERTYPFTTVKCF
ncbi:hypothetical protein Q5P01_000728 [Channa striata]|uniref:Uncharacterized protein n=1 Tax=Channa striata TaxID=64152 RepID=A0AA88IH85_CHASR|nr:hypothetical protein Q5P01_000728 [Channa striata]